MHRAAGGTPNRGGRAYAIPRLPVQAYGRRVQQIPLSGGQAQGQIPGWAQATGSLLNPGANTTIASTAPVTVGGIYTINWTVALSGTPGAGDVNNFQLFVGPTHIANSVNAGAVGSYPQAPVTVNVPAGLTVAIATSGAGTAGTTYTGTIPAPLGSLTLTIGPQGLGTVWYPVQVTLSTTTGPLDPSTAIIYLGPLITPATIVGAGFGNGTYALAIPPMTPGQYLVAVWSGGNPGDTAAMNVIGTMDALTTG